MNDTVRLHLNPDADSSVREPATFGEVVKDDAVGQLEITATTPAGPDDVKRLVHELGECRAANLHLTAEVARLSAWNTQLLEDNRSLRDRLLAQGRD